MVEHFDTTRTHLRTGLALILAAALALLLTSCHSSDAPSSRNVNLAACHLKGIDTELRCGTISVPENRDQNAASHRQIQLWFAVLPSVARNALADPIVVIAGGPGQSASSVAGGVMPLFSKLNRTRDILFIDQRGTGHSQPLNCAPPKGVKDLASQLDPAIMLASLPACAQGFLDRHIDVTHYLTTDAVADLEDVRRALGYASFNLWGGSYGTRVALEYLREYPDHVRTEVLDGVAPSSLILPVDLAADSDAALNAAISSCAADPACASAYPNLVAQIDQMFQQLSHGTIPARLADPVTGTVANVPLTEDTFAAWLRTPLYNPLTSSLVPEAVASAASGDFGTLAALNLSVSGDVFDQLSLGMHLSVVCSEDMQHVSSESLAAVANTRFKDTFYRLYQAMCQHWPKRAVAASFYQPITSDRPILMLAGGRDPATPPRHAQSLLPTLSNARLVVAKNLGHGLSSVGCTPDLIDRFIRSADARALDVSCIENVPATPFYLPLKPRSAS